MAATAQPEPVAPEGRSRPLTGVHLLLQRLALPDGDNMNVGTSRYGCQRVPQCGDRRPGRGTPRCETITMCLFLSAQHSPAVSCELSPNHILRSTIV